MENFTATEILALANAINAAAKKAAQTEMAPTGLDKKGNIEKSQAVDFTVRVTGDLGRAEDGDKKSTSSVLNKLTIALLIKRMGCTKEAALETLAEVMQESMVLGKDRKAAKKILDEVGITAAEKEFDAKVISKLPRTPVMGKVAATVNIEKVA